MARARKGARTLEDQIIDVDIEIEMLKEEISKLKAKRKKLMAQKDQEDMQKIMDLVKESGKTPAEFLVALSQSGQTGE